MTEHTDNSRAAFATLGQFLEEDKWYPKRLDEQYVYRTGFSGENGETPCYAIIVMDRDQFLFYVQAPVKVPEEVRPAVAEFITRANYGMRIGGFEMDYRDGEVRYRSSLDFEGTTLAPALIGNAIYPAVHTMDRYLPGLMAVIYGSLSAAEAIDLVENDTQ